MDHQSRASSASGTGEVGYESEEGGNNAATPTTSESACSGQKGTTERDQTTAFVNSVPVQDPKQLSTHELLKCSAQQFVDDINAKRKRDTALLEEFKETLGMHSSAAYSSMETTVYNMYERNHTAIQEKLQELFSLLDSIAKQEQELEDFKGTLAALYGDVQEPNNL